MKAVSTESHPRQVAPRSRTAAPKSNAPTATNNKSSAPAAAKSNTPASSKSNTAAATSGATTTSTRSDTTNNNSGSNSKQLTVTSTLALDTSFDDYDDWEFGTGTLVIDLDADIERDRKRSKTPSPQKQVQIPTGTPPTATVTTSAAVTPVKMSSVEHQATVDKGLKMKIKRKNVGARSMDTKHEIVKNDGKGSNVAGDTSNSHQGHNTHGSSSNNSVGNSNNSNAGNSNNSGNMSASVDNNSKHGGVNAENNSKQEKPATKGRAAHKRERAKDKNARATNSVAGMSTSTATSSTSTSALSSPSAAGVEVGVGGAACFLTPASMCSSTPVHASAAHNTSANEAFMGGSHVTMDSERTLNSFHGAGSGSTNNASSNPMSVSSSVKKEVVDPYEFNAKVEDRTDHIGFPVKKIKIEKVIII